MFTDEVPQCHEQLTRMSLIMAVESRADIIMDHVADLFAPMFLVQEIAGKSGCGDLRNVFVFGNG